MLAVGVIVAAVVAVVAGIIVAIVLSGGDDNADVPPPGTPVPTATTDPNITPGPITPPALDVEPTVTASGLQIFDIVVGTGEAAVAGSTVTVHYTGWLEDGTKFDSSLDRGVSFPVTLGQTPPQVIGGWEEGLLGMQAGGKRRLIIPPELAYGEAGSGSVIPPNATLIFDIDVLEVAGPPTPAPTEDDGGDEEETPTPQP
jgi:peptidylprolyl isomerase